MQRRERERVRERSPLRELGTGKRSRISATSRCLTREHCFTFNGKVRLCNPTSASRGGARRRRRRGRRRKRGRGDEGREGRTSRRRRRRRREEEEGRRRWYRGVRSPWLTMMRRACVFTCTRFCHDASGLPRAFPELRLETAVETFTNGKLQILRRKEGNRRDRAKCKFAKRFGRSLAKISSKFQFH